MSNVTGPPITVKCNVSARVARFDVHVSHVSGSVRRVFKGCGIQGSGGALDGIDALDRARNIWAGARVPKNRTMRLITHTDAFSDKFVDVLTSDIVSIEVAK